MKAIVTKYHPPDWKRGPRYSATDNDGNRVSIKVNESWSDSNQGHVEAAKELCRVMDWHGGLVQGALLGVGEVFVWRQSGMACANELVV